MAAAEDKVSYFLQVSQFFINKVTGPLVDPVMLSSHCRYFSIDSGFVHTGADPFWICSRLDRRCRVDATDMDPIQSSADVKRGFLLCIGNSCISH